MSFQQLIIARRSDIVKVNTYFLEVDYPKINKWNATSLKWVAVDNSDQTTEDADLYKKDKPIEVAKGIPEPTTTAKGPMQTYQEGLTSIESNLPEGYRQFLKYSKGSSLKRSIKNIIPV